jgi:hypothetical protein
VTPPWKETEPWEIVYFKLYKSQISVIEQALRMCGDPSIAGRRHRLERLFR